MHTGTRAILVKRIEVPSSSVGAVVWKSSGKRDNTNPKPGSSRERSVMSCNVDTSLELPTTPDHKPDNKLETLEKQILTDISLLLNINLMKGRFFEGLWSTF